MKLNPFHHHDTPAAAPPAKPLQAAPVAPAPRAAAGPPPRVWSLLLPPGFTRDRR